MRGRGYAPRGRTPVVRGCPPARRAEPDCGGEQSRRIALDDCRRGDDAATLIRFLQRLIRDAKRKVLLILDRLRVHWAARDRDWLTAHRAKIEVFYLPAYSPELNPEEGLNADLKQVVTRQAPARSKQQLKRATVRHMRRLSKLPARVRSYFSHKPVRYAASSRQ